MQINPENTADILAYVRLVDLNVVENTFLFIPVAANPIASVSSLTYKEIPVARESRKILYPGMRSR